MAYMREPVGWKLNSWPTCEKCIVPNGHLKHITAVYKQGNQATMPSTMHEALDVTEEDIPKGEISAPLMNIYFSFWNYMLAIQSQGILTQMVYPQLYFRWIFHRWISTITPSLWVLARSVVTCASASLFVVSTSVRKGRRVPHMILLEPCSEVFKWRVLTLPSWMGVGYVPDNGGYRELWGMFQRETDFG